MSEGDNRIFYAKFIDGYSFRKFIEYIKIKEDFVFYASKEGIFHSSKSSDESVINILDIVADELIEYHYNGEDEDTIVSVGMGSFKSFITNIGKTDGFEMYKYKNDSKLYMRLNSSKTEELSRGNETGILTHEICDHKMYGYLEYPSNKPNQKMDIKAFSTVCKHMSKAKLNEVYMIGMPEGFQINGLTDDGMLTSGMLIGNTEYEYVDNNNFTVEKSVEEVKSEKTDDGKKKIYVKHGRKQKPGELCKVKVSTSIVKNLSNFDNFSQRSVVRIYADPELPIKIECKVGHYAKLTVYIKGYN